jgi:hypothetical protein
MTTHAVPPAATARFNGDPRAECGSDRTRLGYARKTLRHIMQNGFLFRLQRDTTGADACRLRLRTYSISRLNATLT